MFDLSQFTVEFYEGPFYSTHIYGISATGRLTGEASGDIKRGWRLDEGHFNFWDWTAGKKGKGGKYGHEFFEGATGPHSKFPGYTEWQ